MQTRLGERSAAWRRQLPRQHPRKGGRVPLSQHHHVTNASSESSNRNVPRAGGPSAQPRPGGSNLENGMDGGSRPSTSTLKNSISKTSSITVTPAASASSLNRSLLVALAEQFQREALPWIQDLVVPLLEGPPQPLRGPTEPPEKLADRDSRFITVHGVQLHYKMASPGQREGHMTAPAGAAATAPRTQSAENMPAAAAASSPAASGHKRVPVTAPLPPPMTTSHRESPEPSAPFQVSSVMVGRSGSSSTTTTSSLPSLSSLSSSSSTSGSVSTLRSSSPLVGGGSGNSASPPNPHPSPDAAPMLLLMHGLNGSTFSWRLLMDDLSAYVSPSTGGCRVVAYDRPPYGLSQRPLTWRREEDNPYTLAGGARLAAGLLDALLGPTPAQSAASGAAPGAAVLQQRASDVGKQAVLVGHSAGASVAVETALRYPERVCGLVLIAPAISTDPRGFLARADLGQLLRFAWTRSLLSVDGPGLHYVRRQVMKRKAEVEAGRLGLYADEREVPQEVIDGYLRPLRARDWDVGMLMAYRSLQVSGGPPHLEQLRVPVLVLQGREDRTVPMETAQAVAAALKRRQGAVTEVVVLEHCAHVPMDEQPLEVLSAIADFVNRHCCVLPP